ncbi:MAG: TldD/PmbA family protein [bacterium]
MYGAERLFAMAESLFPQASADGVEISFKSTEQGLTRFANSYIHQNMLESNCCCTIRVAFGQQIGVASSNDISPTGLTRTLKTAETIARLAKANLHFPGLPGPQTYRTLETFDPATTDFAPMQRAEALKRVFDIAEVAGVTVAGAFFTGSDEIAIANSNGLRAYQPGSFANLNVVALTDDFSGAAHGITRRIGELDAVAVGERAIRKAKDGHNPTELPVGQYDVVMEPSAIAELMEWTGYVGLGSKAYEEGSSFLCNHLGEPMAGPNITLYDDAFDTGFTSAFDAEGIPKQRVDFIRDGVATGIVYDRISGHKTGHESTGHMAGTTLAGEGSAPMHLHLAGGTDTEAGLIGQVEKGILITRTHYVNGFLDPRILKMTGLTRDGAFLIEHGKVTRGVKNMRFTQSVLESLNKVAGLSREREACPAWWGAAGSYCMPTVLIRDFAFTGKTDH